MGEESPQTLNRHVRDLGFGLWVLGLHDLVTIRAEKCEFLALPVFRCFELVAVQNITIVVLAALRIISPEWAQGL